MNGDTYRNSLHIENESEVGSEKKERNSLKDNQTSQFVSEFDNLNKSDRPQIKFKKNNKYC